MNLHKIISESIIKELAGIPALAGADLSQIAVETPKNREFGDFATNAAMVLARPLKQNPRLIADMMLPHIAALSFVADTSIAGPGFINIKLKDGFILEFVQNKQEIKNQKSEVIDLDYGSYNVAKSLHIGHLRGGIIGDTFYRIAKYLGHRPISYNHLGDWGKPMALVIAWIIKKFPNDWNKPEFKIDESEFNTYYPTASEYSKQDPEFLTQVLNIKKDFQDGHPDYFALYEKMLKISLRQMSDVVHSLNMLPFDNNLGERNAAKYLAPVEKILRDKNLLQESDGAEVIVLKREDDKAPMPPYMWTDSRGADTYDSTDLAAVYYKKITDNPDKMIFFTDYRQQLHFAQLFRAAELSGIYPSDKMEFPYFGGINGADGRPYKTRSGNVAGLLDIIGMVNDAARARVAESGKNLPDDIIEMIALSALKFNDLMHDMKSDYVFDPDAVTQFEGRTGPYILYTAVRMNSVLKKAGNQSAALSADLLVNEERELILTILDFERVIQNAFEKRATDMLANYAYDLAQLINTFYHNCPILREDVNADTRAHRLGIVRIAIAALSKAVDLMGMKIPEEM
ncbi:MAG: arginine--tRNA ligase [Rickettsiales bacterium]|jgi:arginyl-tRNA synthetase|nr:arginine--tRNA ligase [Rickettsiales bacterium]